MADHAERIAQAAEVLAVEAGGRASDLGWVDALRAALRAVCGHCEGGGVIGTPADGERVEWRNCPHCSDGAAPAPRTPHCYTGLAAPAVAQEEREEAGECTACGLPVYLRPDRPGEYDHDCPPCACGHEADDHELDRTGRTRLACVLVCDCMQYEATAPPAEEPPLERVCDDHPPWECDERCSERARAAAAAKAAEEASPRARWWDSGCVCELPPAAGEEAVDRNGCPMCPRCGYKLGGEPTIQPAAEEAPEGGERRLLTYVVSRGGIGRLVAQGVEVDLATSTSGDFDDLCARVHSQLACQFELDRQRGRPFLSRNRRAPDRYAERAARLPERRRFDFESVSVRLVAADEIASAPPPPAPEEGGTEGRGPSAEAIADMSEHCIMLMREHLAGVGIEATFADDAAALAAAEIKRLREELAARQREGEPIDEARIIASFLQRLADAPEDGREEEANAVLAEYGLTAVYVATEDTLRSVLECALEEEREAREVARPEDQREGEPVAPPEGQPFRVVEGPSGCGLVAWTGEQVDGQLFTREHADKRAALLNRLFSAWAARSAPAAPAPAAEGAEPVAVAWRWRYAEEAHEALPPEPRKWRYADTEQGAYRAADALALTMGRRVERLPEVEVSPLFPSAAPPPADADRELRRAAEGVFDDTGIGEVYELPPEHLHSVSGSVLRRLREALDSRSTSVPAPPALHDEVREFVEAAKGLVESWSYIGGDIWNPRRLAGLKADSDLTSEPSFVRFQVALAALERKAGEAKP